MFTGIVQQLGTVTAVQPADHGAVLRVDPGAWSHRPETGSSIAVNGVCLTVTAGEPAGARAAELRFDVIAETLRSSALGDLAAGDPVNLEHAVTPATLMGGHVVQGHVDGVGTVRAVIAGDGETRVTITAPAALAPYIVHKGSIAVEGVSLTVAALDDDGFTVALIPTTLDRTTLGRLCPGQRVNVETDCLVRAVVHWLEMTGR